MKIRIVFILLLLISCESKEIEDFSGEEVLEEGIFIDDWTYKVLPKAGDIFEEAVFRFWVPEKINPRAILVLSPHSNGNGLHLSNIDEWKEFAEKEKLILVGTHLTSKLSVDSYINSKTTGDALLLAITKVMEKRNLDTNNDLPILLRGFSGGGSFSFYFSQFFPKRTLAFANIKGPIVIKEIKDENKNVPGIVIIGEEDVVVRNEQAKSAFSLFREAGAFWCFAEEPKTGHIIGESDELVRSFFSEILEKRLVNGELKIMNEKETILGDITTYNYFHYNDFIGDKSKAACLINDEFAQVWKVFVSGS